MLKLKRRFLILGIMVITLLSGLFSNTQVHAASSNERQIYDFLKSHGFNTAAAVGILANIEMESNFNPNAKGDYVNGSATSYGICQWHNDRWSNLKSYRPNDWQTLLGIR